MIDVSRFTVGDHCPRCVERRVFAVDVDNDRWLCVRNEIPQPWLREQMTEHAADDLPGVSRAERTSFTEEMMRMMRNTDVG